MPDRKILELIITDLQTAANGHALTRSVVERATNELRDLNYYYNDEKYPQIADAVTFTDTSGNSPSSLAEALLWKLGRWKAYKNFVEKFADPNSDMDNQDVVFTAFAKHLRDRNNSIYDQHALRALWAMGGAVSVGEKSICKSVLVNEREEWKDAGYGANAVNGYRLFEERVNTWTAQEEGPTRISLDRLMMPLGKALKKESPNGYHAFCALCGWPAETTKTFKKE
jgi:hypothetical protein